MASFRLSRCLVGVQNGWNIETESFLVRPFSLPICARAKRPVFEGPLPPKKTGSPYTAFVSDFWKQYLKSGKTPNIVFSEVSKEVYKAWRVLPENEKKVYITLHQENLKEYKKVLAEFKINLGDDEKVKEYFRSHLQYKRDLKNYKHMKQNRVKGFSRITGYHVMVKEKCAVLPVDQRKDFCLNRAGPYWKSLDTSERELYSERAKKLREDMKNES